MIDVSNFAKTGLHILPPPDPADTLWRSAGDAIMDVMTGKAGDPQIHIDDIKALETTARAISTGEQEFLKAFTALRDRIAQRAADRGENRGVALEAAYYRMNWFLYGLAFFLIGGDGHVDLRRQHGRPGFLMDHMGRHPCRTRLLRHRHHQTLHHHAAPARREFI